MASPGAAKDFQDELARLQARIAELEAAEQEKCEAQDALRELNDNLRAIIENTDDYILMSDHRARPVIFNSAYARIMKELLGLDMRPGIKPHTLVEDPQVQAFWEDCHRRVLSGERFAVEFGNPIPGGPDFWVEVRFNPVIRDGKVVGFSEVSRDITERKREELQLREDRDALEAEVARRTAEMVELERQVLQAQKLESLGVLAGGIAHDFNNLLMAIVGHADLALLDVPEDNPARSGLLEILQTARQAAELTNQMLAYAGKGTVLVRLLDLNGLIGEMEKLLARSISKKADLRFQLASGLPSVKADTAQLRQIVLNLVTNASEALGGAAGQIRVRTSQATLDEAGAEALASLEPVASGDYVFLEVADEGPGIRPQDLDRIFDPFYTTKFTGRGLGLAAVQGIVRRAKGAIQVDSEPGQGTTFRIYLPAWPGQPAEVDGPDPAELDWQGRGCVLLVDDEASVRDVARSMLTRMGLEVLEARDGAQAIALMGEHGERVDCVLLDLLMPTMDGEETLAALRRLRADLPVVLSSGYDEAATTDRFADRSLAGFIQKPYTLAQLQRVLRGILDP